MPVGLYTALRDPFIQTFIARSAAAYLSKEFNSEVRIGAFYIDLDLSLKLEDVYVGDQQGNTLLSAGSIKMRIFSYEFSKGLSIRDLAMHNIEFQLIKYEGEEDLNLQFITDYFSGGKDKDDTEETSQAYPIQLRLFELQHAKFRYWDQNKDSPGEPGMDFAHIDLEDIDLKIRDFFLAGDSITCRIDKLRADDASGLQLKALSGMVNLSSTGLEFSEFQSVINSSILNLEIAFEYPSYAAFLSFIDSVDMRVLAHPSSLQMEDIGYFAPIMFDMKNNISFAGDFSGTISNLFAKGLSFSFGRSTVFSGDMQLTGLPDIYETFADLNIRRFETETYDLERFALAGDMRYLPLPEEVLKLGKIQVNGVFTGFYNDFYTNADFFTNLGRINSNLEMRQNQATGLFHYNGNLQSVRFDVGKLMNVSETVGKLDMNINVRGKGLAAETADMNLSGSLKQIDFKGNDFKDIELAGDLTGKAFNGRLSIDDPKLKFEFLGRANFADTVPAFDFGAILTHADLYNLNLLDNDTIMQLSTDINVNFTGSHLDNLVGTISIENTRYTDSRDTYHMDSLLLKTTNHGLYPRRLTIESDFLDLDLGGEIDFGGLHEAFKHFTANYVQFRNFEPESDSVSLQDFFIELQFKDTEALSRLLMPSVTLSPDAHYSGVFTNRDQVLNTTFRAGQLTFGNIKLNNLVLHTQSDLWQANLNFNSNEIIFRDSIPGDPTVLGIESPDFAISLTNDSILFRLQWRDERTIARNKGDIHGYYASREDGFPELHISSADLVVNDSVWRISRGNRIVFAEEYTLLQDFHIRLRNQSIGLQGRIPLGEADSLNVQFHNWDISNFDLLTQGAGLDFDGAVNGDLMLANLKYQPTFVSNLQLTDLHLNRERLGEARILSTWSNLDEALYLNAQIINIGNIAASRMLHFTGFFYPNRTDQNLNFELELDNFRLKTIAPFLEGVLSKVEGLASGGIAINGKTSSPELSGKINLMRTAFLIDYLNVKYSLSHEFDIYPDRINFDRLILFDTLGNKANVSGAITHDYFKNFRFNLQLKPEDFLSLNTDRTMNELFYGAAVVSGDVNISGEISNVGLNIKAITRRGTNITIPLATATTVYDNDFIVFLRDPEAEVVEDEPQAAIQGFDINLETTVTPDANLRIFLPANMGSLESTGNGNINLKVNSAGDFSLQGDYIVRAGEFNFMFENLVRRRFELMQGGRISWTGDPYDADIDIKGLYRLKTSIATLGPGIDSTMRSRINVEAVIHLTEQLFNPTIKFSIRLPNVDTETRQMVFSVLDTTNDAMMTQQMLSLLVLGSFSYTGGETASLGASSINMISNQLSNWLSQISRDFDIGLHYKPGDRLSNEELEVALSTQLFNDRVTIDGNFGVIGNRHSTQNASNIVGDVDISVLLTQDGRLRLKAFNHSNTSMWFSSRAYDNFVPYTQGLGISYRQEFDSFGDLLRRRKKKPSNP